MTATTVHPLDTLGEQLQTLSSSARFSPEVLEYVSNMAYNLLSQGRYEDAYRYYGFLAFYAPTDTRFVVGQGICARELDRPAEARLLFDMAACIDPEEPVHSLLSAECMLRLGLVADAVETLNVVKRYCEASGGDEDVARRASAMLELIGNAASAVE